VPIVKPLDNTPIPPLIDHIGWQLWQAAHQWKDQFDSAMIAEGYVWFREARARVLAVLDLTGTPQGELVARLGMTKQAVQQLVDQLVDEGFVKRLPDPADGRSRIVAYTAKGARLMTDANRVKRKLDRAYRKKLGEAAFSALESALHALNGG
jgi:DNA-binding MarR family transcriptional regulator